MSQETDKILFLLTKKFPFGPQETYLFDELEVLKKSFKKIVFVPYDEYEYTDETNRILGQEQVEIFQINGKKSLSKLQQLKSLFYSVRLLLFEVLFGKHKTKHFKVWKKAIVEAKHAYYQAVFLNEFIKDKGIRETVFYNYWLHRGVIISDAYNKLSSKEDNVKIISRSHAFDLYNEDWFKIMNEKNDSFLFFNTYKVKVCNEIHVISKHGIDFLRNRFPKYESKFSIARLGVSDSFVEGKIKEESLSEKVFVTCSWVNERKRIYLIPELIAAMKTPVKWVHFGSGSSDDINKVNKALKQLDLESSFVLKGKTPHQEIIKFYQNNHIDLFLNVSTAEGIPVSLMEAASFGIPMLATNTVGNPEIVTGQNGFVIPVDYNTNDVARDLDDYFKDADQIASKRKASRQMFLDNYHAKKNYSEMVDTLMKNIT